MFTDKMRALLIATAVCAVSLALASAQEGRADSIRAGVYTDEQAVRGQTAFLNNCSECHLADLSGRAGPPLKGDEFLEHWRGKPVAALVEKIKTTMPADWRTQLTESRALDVVGFLLQQNGFPAGAQELTLEAARSVTIER